MYLISCLRSLYFQCCPLFSHFFSLLGVYIVKANSERLEIKIIWFVQISLWNLTRDLVSFNSFVEWLERAIPVGCLDILMSLAKLSISKLQINLVFNSVSQNGFSFRCFCFVLIYSWCSFVLSNHVIVVYLMISFCNLMTLNFEVVF